MYRLRVKTSNGNYTINDKVNGRSKLIELQEAIQQVTSIDAKSQKLLLGYPPQLLVGNENETLTSLGINDGDAIVIEEKKASELAAEELQTARVMLPDPVPSSSSRSVLPQGMLVKKVVPSDNSCLFTSVFYLMNDGNVDSDSVSKLREIVSLAIRCQPDVYTEAVLEKSNEDYSEWIKKDTSWGGAIELSILAEYYQTEIVALDSQSGIVNRFGEDKNYDKRIVVIYDGIHYDPLHMESDQGEIRYIFSSCEPWVLEQAHEIVQRACVTHQYTDTKRFRLRCKACGDVFQGEADATKHAAQTAHQDFHEINYTSSFS